MKECVNVNEIGFEVYKKILIIEHDEKYNKQLSDKLNTLDYIVSSSKSYEDTTKLLGEENFDYIIVNLDSDTSEHNELLNFLKITTNSKLMVLSNSKDTQYQEYLYFNGIVKFLQKDQTIQEVVDVIHSTIKSITLRFILNDILLIQNSSFVIEQINNLLTPRDYKVTVKKDIDNIKDILNSKDFSVVLIDLEMDSIDPLKVIEYIKSTKDQHIPILVLSGNNDATSQEKILQLGVSDIIKKPISSKDFIFKVDFWNHYFKQEYSLLCQQKLLNQYKDIVDRASIVSKTDPKGKITYINKKFCEISGYSEYDLIGKPHNIVRHPDMPKEAFEDMWDTIKNKKQVWHGKVKNKKKDGGFYVVDSFVKPILNTAGEITEFIALRNDITEIEKAKEHFQKQHNILGDNLETAMALAKEYEFAIDESNIVSRTDLQGKITYVNDKFCEVSQYNRDELIGVCHSIVKHPDMKDEIYKELWETITAGKIWKGQIKNLKKYGDDYYVDTLIMPIKDKDKNIIEFMAIRHDVSEIINLHKELEDTQKEIIYKMGEIGETRSKETGHHVKRVALYSELLAKLYGLSDEEATLINLASPMHDIGKVAIPDAVLNKPARLTKEEFDIIKTHATIGYEMLNHSNRPILKTAAIVAYEHHERWDGKGYPRGLKEDEIHIYGRITAIADVFDALGSHRCYKPAWSLDKIIELYAQERGKQFDPKLIDLFLDNIDKFLEIRDMFKDKV